MLQHTIDCPACGGTGHLPLSARLSDDTRLKAETVVGYYGYSLRKRQIAATVLALGSVSDAAAVLRVSEPRIYQVLNGRDRS